MKFDHTYTGNWENAFRGLRHPMESYARSDSEFGILPVDWLNDVQDKYVDKWIKAEKNPKSEKEAFEYVEKNLEINYAPKNEDYEYAALGPNDIDLAQRMISAGSPNDKFLRQIFVCVDITAPLYWWKEADTYKVATVANSTSTMHKLATTPITMDCFETDDMEGDIIVWPGDASSGLTDYHMKDIANDIIMHCEQLRKKYLETKDVRYWKELIRWLPEGWLQTRTWSANYATLRGIYHWRKNHKLIEWHQFCDWIKTLPYADDLILFDND